MEPLEQFNLIPPPIIHVTTDYDQFKILNYNRPINHITKLSKSVGQNNKLYVHPIIVNKDLEIIDGQHRWAYAKESQVPLYYVIDENFDPTDLIAHNVTATNWNAKDYAKFYADCNCASFPAEKRRNYAICLQICEEFKISFDIITRLFHCGRSNNSASSDFKQGKLTFRIGREEMMSYMFQLDEITQYLLKHKLLKKINLDAYYSFYNLIKLEGYDRDRLFKKMDDNLDVLLNLLKFRRSEEIFTRLLEMYNKNAKHRLEPKRKA